MTNKGKRQHLSAMRHSAGILIFLALVFIFYGIEGYEIGHAGADACEALNKQKASLLESYDAALKDLRRFERSEQAVRTNLAAINRLISEPGEEKYFLLYNLQNYEDRQAVAKAMRLEWKSEYGNDLGLYLRGIRLQAIKIVEDAVLNVENAQAVLDAVDNQTKTLDALMLKNKCSEKQPANSGLVVVSGGGLSQTTGTEKTKGEQKPPVISIPPQKTRTPGSVADKPKAVDPPVQLPLGVKPCTVEESAYFSKIVGTWTMNRGPIIVIKGSCEQVSGETHWAEYCESPVNSTYPVYDGTFTGRASTSSVQLDWEQLPQGVHNRKYANSGSCELKEDGTLSCSGAGCSIYGAHR
jgi:hypothetical protein